MSPAGLRGSSPRHPCFIVVTVADLHKLGSSLGFSLVKQSYRVAWSLPVRMERLREETWNVLPESDGDDDGILCSGLKLA